MMVGPTKTAFDESMVLSNGLPGTDDIAGLSLGDIRSVIGIGAWFDNANTEFVK
jgi:hypothetical protein